MEIRTIVEQKIHMKGTFIAGQRFINKFSVYALNKNKEDILKNQSLEREIYKISNNDIQIVIGDLNGKVGKEGYFQIIGKYSMYEESYYN